MREHPIGQSRIPASVVGLGTWAIGGFEWGGTDEKESIAAIHAALDAGVTLIDTAPIYGFGLSEEILGRALRDRRDDVVLATKCGLVCNTRAGEHVFNADALGPSPDGHIQVYRYLEPESIRLEVEASLRRLRTDRIDLYQTHWPDPTTPIEATMETLLALKSEGKIRAIGVSNVSTEHMDAYRAVGPLDADQEKYSMLDRHVEQDQLPYCAEHDIALLAYSPLEMGLLTGKSGPDREFAETDQRSHHDRFSRANRERIQKVVGKLREIAEKTEITVAQLAIAWTLHQPGVTHVLCGARNRRQAWENATAADVTLADEDLKTIEEALALEEPILI